MAREALLVIDMLGDFLAPEGSLFIGAAAAGVERAVAGEIARAREQRRPVVYICDRHRPDDAEFAMFSPHCIAASPGAEVVPALKPQPGDLVVPKRRYSAFYGTDLDLSLREKGIDKLILTGVCTNICVLYTAADARMRGYEVEVVREAVASFDPAAHEFALQEMEKTLGVRVR